MPVRSTAGISIEASRLHCTLESAHMQNNTDDESRSQQQNETVQNLRTGMQDDTGLSAQAIADLRRKVKSGHYLTRDSAELSASRILDANETPIQ